ncbi:MAG: mechanosensitive ion channel domain-containing protein [Verrucomicrobiota bacterium]
MLFQRISSKLKLGCVLVATLAMSPHSTAQAPGLKKVLETMADGKAAAPVAADKPDDTAARLQLWQKEARESLARLDDPAATTSLPAGIAPVDLEERRGETEQILLNTGRYLKALDVSVAERKALDATRAESEAWVGFKEIPPYSILMLDELRNEQDAVRGKLSSFESSMIVFQRTLATVLKETKENEEISSRIPLDGDDAVKWKREASQTKARLFAVRAGFIQCNCEILRYQIESTKVELSLLDRKIKLASANSRFSNEDLAKIEATTSERKAALTKELDAVVKRQKSAAAARKQELAALDALQAAAPQDKPPEGLNLAKFRLEVANERVDLLESVAEGFENLIQLEVIILNSYQDRKTYIDATKPDERVKSLLALNDLKDRLSAWQIFLDNEISGVNADLGKLDSRYASTDPSDAKSPLLMDQRKGKAEKLMIYQRIYRGVDAQLKLLSRWVDDFTPKEKKTFYQKVSDAVLNAWDFVKRIWSFEVTSSDEKFEVQGQVFTKKVPVTLGELLRALIFFGIGYGILSWIANRIQGGIVRRGHIADAQAKTLRNWAMIVVAVFLAIGTLSLLNIPITIFAFFGGALAIGLGFGSQALIKNFISGIIVLFERKIRVGDIVDVGGLSGSITEINTRSSVLRGGDGKETLVPNSYFLENRVTNLTLSNRRVRRTLTVRVALGSSPQTVSTLLKECVERHGLILKEPAPIITFEDITDNAYVFTAYFWTEFNDKTNADVVASDIRFMLEKRFVEAEIEFAGAKQDFPMRTDQPLQLEWVNKPNTPLV